MATVCVCAGEPRSTKNVSKHAQVMIMGGNEPEKKLTRDDEPDEFFARRDSALF